MTEPAPLAPEVCFRCGAFLESRAEGKRISGRRFCLSCAARPEVDYLETFRRQHWGKRDSFGWLAGLGAIGSALALLSSLSRGAFVFAAANLFLLIVMTCFFLGQRWARLGLLAALATTVVNVALNPERDDSTLTAHRPKGSGDGGHRVVFLEHAARRRLVAVDDVRHPGAVTAFSSSRRRFSSQNAPNGTNEATKARAASSRPFTAGCA